ncbi:MAG: hypothetical protein M3O15_12085 [Acidobacteriota bacterium]|nr:hypothetical protein [Acidobacteriota bacterium]
MKNPSILATPVLLAALLTCGLATPAVPSQPDGDITLEVMASKQWRWQDDRSLTGHAFICVGLKVASGVKEECFGFYPQGGGKGAVYGPGCVDSEVNGRCGDHPITRFSNIDVSVKKPITEEQRRAVYALGTQWSRRPFVLGVADCVAFANAVAAAAGLKTPESTLATTPTRYVARLKELNP